MEEQGAEVSPSSLLLIGAWKEKREREEDQC